MKLWAPTEYWFLTEDEKAHYKCGPGRGILEKLIPEKWYFGWPLVKPLVITPSCSIHDFCYEWGPDTAEWKCTSDEGFGNNLVRQVEFAALHYSRLYYFVTRIRLRYAHAGYLAVKKFGGPAFWNTRNKQEEMGFVNGQH